MKHIGQSRTASLLEAALNVCSGFFVSLLVWSLIVVPYWNLPVNMAENLQITLLFTVVSVIRSYVWRRIFNWIHRRQHV